MCASLRDPNPRGEMKVIDLSKADPRPSRVSPAGFSARSGRRGARRRASVPSLGRPGRRPGTCRQAARRTGLVSTARCPPASTLRAHTLGPERW